MKKAFIGVVAGVLLGVGLAGCTPGNNTVGSTAVGAAAGGLLAGALFHGRGNLTGIAAGALIGGSIGYIVGRRMDRQDRINMQSAIVNTPVNEEASWTNQKTDVTYQVRPTRNYRQNGRYCREYTTRVNVGGKWRTAYGRACRMPDGQWKIVK